MSTNIRPCGNLFRSAKIEIADHPDGLWLIFPAGEEAGPFAQIEDAEAFLGQLERLQGARDPAGVARSGAT